MNQVRPRFGGILPLCVTAIVLSARPALAADLPPDLQLLYSTAKTSAIDALISRPECADRLNDLSGFGVPRASIREVLPRNKETYVPVAPPPRDPNSSLSTTFLGGFEAPIMVHDPFRAVEIIYNGTFRPDIVDPFDPANQRTVLVLHELGHLTGREGEHQNEGQYNVDIANACLPLVVSGSNPDPVPPGFCDFNQPACYCLALPGFCNMPPDECHGDADCLCSYDLSSCTFGCSAVGPIAPGGALQSLLSVGAALGYLVRSRRKRKTPLQS